MGYLSSAVGKPLKWIGGAAAIYGGYKLATQNGSDISQSVSGAFDGLEEDSDGLEAAATLLESTGQQVNDNPEYGANLGTAGKGLAAAAIGAYLDGSISMNDLDY
ncbi:MAG: hypothetical protein ABEJ87_04525 [Candidatus Nanohalobium sp.]